MKRLGRNCSAVAVGLGALLAGCSSDDPVTLAADAICSAIDGEPSDEVAFGEYERALARERRAGLDQDELLAALEERCGRTIAAISAAAEAPEPEPEPEPVDLETVDWTGVEWATVCTEHRSEGIAQLAREDGAGVWRAVADSPTPALHVPLDAVLYGDVNGDNLDDAIFVVECVFSGAHAEHFIEVWSHDEDGTPTQLETLANFTREDGVITALEMIDDRLRVHTAEGRDGDNQPHINGYPLEVVTDWHHDGSGWVDKEISRTDTTPEPEPEPEPQPEPEPEPTPEPAPAPSPTACDQLGDWYNLTESECAEILRSLEECNLRLENDPDLVWDEESYGYVNIHTGEWEPPCDI
jgi:hypothetical protein